MEMTVHPDSFLFVTLDSCRYDTFEKANIPNIKGIGPYRKCFTIANFTYPAHQAFFMGFLPGDRSGQKYWDSRKARIFHLHSPTSTKENEAYIVLRGRNIVQGFRNRQYRTMGIGAMGWFNPQMPSGKVLTEDFAQFHYTTTDIDRQVNLARNFCTKDDKRPIFLFINVGETHTPYWHKGAKWSAHNYCLPFQQGNDRAKCEVRQKACLEYVDRKIKPILDLFANASTIVCSDHGDAWGEQGLWEHSVTCPPVMTVPMTFRLK